MKILLTGADGLLGNAIREIAEESDHRIVPLSRKDADLADPAQVRAQLKSHSPDCIIHAAAVVAGIELNRDKPQWMYDQNSALNTAVLSEAASYGVPKVLSFLSTCVFPPDAPEPWAEELIQAGEVDDRHWGYARAKRELDTLSARLTAESGGRSLFTTLTPSTMYGPGDYYGPDRSHVLAALTLKFHLAATSGDAVTLWGTGSPRREFLLSLDLARVSLWAADHYEDEKTMIVSPDDDISILDLSKIVAEAVGYEGEVNWDTSRPDGTPSRRTSAAKLRARYPVVFSSLRDGVARAVGDFQARFPAVRGVSSLAD